MLPSHVHHQPKPQPRPPPPVSPPRKASLKLDFIVVGGNIGGLACAYVLASAGHHVRVLERCTQNTRTSWTGMRCTPNLSKILAAWGLRDELRAKSIPCKDITFRDIQSGERIGCLTWREEVLEETGGDHLLMHHRDLYDMLYRITTEAGAQIIHGANVVDVIPGDSKDEASGSERSFTSGSTPDLVRSPSALSCVELESTSISVTGHGPPSVVLASGEILTADIVVGVDGSESLVRNVVLKPEHDHGTCTDMDILSTTYTFDQLEPDPELKRLVDEPIWDLWMGSGASILGYPVGNRKEYSLHVCWSRRRMPEHIESEEAPDWGGTYPHELFAEMIQNDDCTPIIQKLAKLPAQVARAKHIILPTCEQWVHDSRTILIMGEAAHPNMPCSNQSAAMCVEDATVFGGLFSRLRSWDQVPLLMEAFQDIRQARTEFVAIQDQANAQLCQLPPGPDRDGRNEAMLRNMNLGMEGWDDKMIQEQWDGICEVFGYSAMDAADDWWVGWGMLGEMAKKRNGDKLEISVSVVPELQIVDDDDGDALSCLGKYI